jgi:hypothetical protein
MWIVLEHKETKEQTEYKSIQEAMKALTLSRVGLRRRYVIHQKYFRGYWKCAEWRKDRENEKDECLITDE